MNRNIPSNETDRRMSIFTDSFKHLVCWSSLNASESGNRGIKPDQKKLLFQKAVRLEGKRPITGNNWSVKQQGILRCGWIRNSNLFAPNRLYSRASSCSNSPSAIERTSSRYPPIEFSPTKICGSVDCPERCSSSSRSAGLLSAAISSNE